jgi:RHS repeat-associated protein
MKNIKEQKDYYPFGKEHENSSLMSSTNRWGYNGKEKQTIRDLGWLDFMARMYANCEMPIFTTQDPLAEKYYSVSPYVYCMNNPLKFVDSDGKQPRIYIQSKGLGHAFVTVNEGQNTIVYSYGRYGSVGSSGIASGRFTPVGEGVLHKKTGEEAQKYLAEVQSEGKFSIYTINNADDNAVASFYDEQWDNGTRPTDENKASYTDENAKVVDTYNLLNNNCVTKSIDGINNKDNILDYTHKQVAGTTYDGITYYQSININSPSRLKQYLDNLSKSNINIVKIENPQEFIRLLQEQIK